MLINNIHTEDFEYSKPSVQIDVDHATIKIGNRKGVVLVEIVETLSPTSVEITRVSFAHVSQFIDLLKTWTESV